MGNRVSSSCTHTTSMDLLNESHRNYFQGQSGAYLWFYQRALLAFLNAPSLSFSKAHSKDFSSVVSGVNFGANKRWCRDIWWAASRDTSGGRDNTRFLWTRWLLALLSAYTLVVWSIKHQDFCVSFVLARTINEPIRSLSALSMSSSRIGSVRCSRQMTERS